ncbi:M20/M25/M40 family metallo-hydrolase [Vicingaceae bacterium]|nr:M20/M25/M40 family metallo-hydrolase [Vicingaceae bacterium]
MRGFLFLISFVASLSCFSQDIGYARSIVDTLTSEYFSGRGALNDGEKKAASFIKKQYEENGLKPLGDSFFQEFSSPINVFPGEISVKIDGQSLNVGEDFLIDPSSGGVKGSFEIVWYNAKNIPSKKQLKKLAYRNYFVDKIVVLDDKGVDKNDSVFRLLKGNNFNAAGIFLIKEKLTHSLSKKRNGFVSLKVKRGVIRQTDKIITLNFKQKFLSSYQSQNVIGLIEGAEHPDSFIILSAHYDHLGKLGEDVFFPGANDNASGLAMLLNMAKHYNKKRPKKSIVFIAFGAEEIGLVGSRFFVENPLIPLRKINFVFNMDLMGTGSKGGMIVNGEVYKEQFSKLLSINNENGYLPVLKMRGKAANSDHYWFSERNVPSFFIYLMGGISAYHDIEDVSKTLPLTKFEDSFHLILDFVDEL